MSLRTVGVIGLGKIAMPIAEHLVKSGYRVVGFRRSAMTQLEAAGGIPKASAAAVAQDSDFIISCLPSEAALDDVIAGPHGLLTAIRGGQIVLELGTYPVEVKLRQRDRLPGQRAGLYSGESNGNPRTG